MKKLLILLLLPFLILIGCNKDDDQTQEQLTPETFVKVENEIISVSNNTIILSGNQNDIEANDIIVSGANDNAPYGFLRKVTSKSSSNGNTILQTQRTTISEAVKYFYEEGEVYEGGINYTFQPSDTSGRSSNQNKLIPITISINETINTNQGGVPVEINLSGEITITPHIIFNIAISNNFFSPRIEEFHFSIGTENEFNVTLNTQADLSFDTDDIALGSFTGAPITIMVGIPIVIIPKFTLYIGANGNLNASIVYTYSNNSTAISGITYDNGWQYLPESGFTVINQNATATASVIGNAKAYIKPEFSLSLYDDDFVSSGISVEPYARFEGSISSSQYNWLINGGIDTGAFFKVQAFGFGFVDEEWNHIINIPEWEIASGVYDLASITNPSPMDNSTVTSQPLTFSWQPNDFTVTPTFEILLGQNSNSLNSIGTTINTNFTNPNVLSNDTFYWKVIARDVNNTFITESPLWSFTTEINTDVILSDYTFLATRFSTTNQLGNYSFSSDGLHLYMVINGDIHHFNLPAPYDISNLTSPNEILELDSSQGGSSIAKDVTVNQNGTIMYVQADRPGSFNDDYFQQYTLNNPYSINNVSYIDRKELNYKYNKMKLSSDGSKLYIAYHDFFSTIFREIREFEFSNIPDITSINFTNSTPQIYQGGQSGGISYDIVDSQESIYITDNRATGLTKKFIMNIPGDISSIDANQPQSSVNLNVGERIVKVVGNEERFFTLENNGSTYQINEYIRN